MIDGCKSRKTRGPRALISLAAWILMLGMTLGIALPAMADSFDVGIDELCPGASDGDECIGGVCRVDDAAPDQFICTAPTTDPTDTGTTAPPPATVIAPRDLPNPLGTASIPELIARVITIFTAVAGSIALLMFVYGGVMWLISGGSSERIEKGKKAMVWAVIGLAVIFGGYAILRALFRALGAEL